MKKLTALLLTLIVVLGGFTPAFAAAPGIKDNHTLATQNVNPGAITLALPPTMFVEYSNIDFSKLDVVISNLKINNLPAVEGTSLVKATPAFRDNGGVPVMDLVLTAPQTTIAQTISADFAFTYDKETPSATTATATWVGIINPYPAGTVLGLKTGPIAPTGQSGYTNAQFEARFPLTDFVNTQGGVAPLSTAGLNVSSSNTNFEASFDGSDLVIKSATATPSAINNTIVFKMTFAGSPELTINLPITITAPPATITYVNFSNSVAPEIKSTNKTVNTALVLPAGTLTLSVPLSSISYDNGASTTALITYLNTNPGDFVSLSGMSKNVSPFRHNGNNVEVDLTVTTGTYNNVSVQLGKGTLTANPFPTKVIVYTPSATSSFLGIRTRTFSTPTVTSMVVNDRILYEISASDTYWTGSAPTQYDTTLNNTANITVTTPTSSPFTYKFVYEGGKHYFQLTATTTGNSYSSAFYTITDNITGGVITVPLPNATITTAVGLSGNKITGIASGASLEDNFYVNDETVSESIDDLEVHPGDVITLEFDSSFFDWSPLAPNPPVSLTSSVMNTGKIALSTSSTTGPVESVKLVYKNNRSYVEILIDDTVNSTKDVNFSARIYFSVSGSRHTSSSAYVKGVVTQEVYEVYDGDDVDMTEYPTIEAAETVRNGTFYIGNDMTIHANLTRGRTYHASSNTDLTVSDTNTLNKYPELVEALHIDQTNFPSSSTVSFDTAERYYVYDADGNYLGTTDDKVALKSTYYLATKRITFGTAVNETSGSSVAEGSGSSSGSGTTPGSYNPSTGR